MLSEVLAFMGGFSDLFGLVLIVMVAFGAVELVVRILRESWGRP